MIIREGQPFVARVMIGNRIVGFATTVLRSCAVPYRYLHLSYPDEMEQITVHKAQRVRVKLFASAKNSNPEFQSDKPQPAAKPQAKAKPQEKPQPAVESKPDSKTKND